MKKAQNNIVSIIDKKRRGGTHSEEEIRFLVETMVSGETADYQVSAWLMASCIQGLNLDEATWLTQYFVESGEVLDLSSIEGVVVDKHSTGGVGDKTTLILVPLLAVTGVNVVKLSGRGLGFTGGTIDKLEAIPGFRVSLSNDEMLAQIKQIGAAISSQTADLAPADGQMYALRDVTSTVDNIPLIAASVVSKKIATGAQAIVLDIKVGRGAFMKTREEAQELAETCREVGWRLGRSISTVISSMDQPLGYAIGHTLEVIEVLETLKGKGPDDLRELCLKLGGVLLLAAGKFSDLDKAEAELASHLDDGRAYQKFQELVSAQGGELEALDDPDLMPQPERIRIYPASKSGYVKTLDSLKIAQAAKSLGAGRSTKESPIDLGVGVVLRKKIGDYVEEGEALVELFIGKKNEEEAFDLLKEAIVFSDSPVESPALVEELSLGEALKTLQL